MEANNERFTSASAARYAPAMRESEVGPAKMATTLQHASELGSQWLSSRQPGERSIEIVHAYSDSEGRWASIGMSIHTRT
jgi:hypothetical protein